MNLKGLVKIDDVLVVCVDEVAYFYLTTEEDHHCEITLKNGSKILTTATVAEVWEAINEKEISDMPEERVTND